MPDLWTRLTPEMIAHYEAAGFWGRDTIYALVKAHAQRAPDAYAVRDRFRRLTYRELLQAADALAADLAARNVEPQQRVAVWLPSRIEGVVALLACSRNGLICCPSLHRDHTVGEVGELLRRMRAAALIVQTGYGADAARNPLDDMVATVPTLRHVYRLEPANGADPAVFVSRSVPVSGAVSRDITQVSRNVSRIVSPPVSHDANQVVYLAFTSGTTGQPKGVMHSDNTLLANARQLARDWHIDSRSVVFTLSPLSHNLGFGAQVMALATGGELVINDLPRGTSLADRILETGTSFLVGVPAHAVDLLNEMRARNLNGLGRMKGFRISGAAAPSEVIAGLIAQGIVPQSGYGMTETCSHQYTLPTDDARRIVETAGRACANYELRIFKIDDADTEASAGETGQIGGRGASLMLGYFEDPETTAKSFNKSGWFMTGDLGTLDADFYLRIAGRSKDIIIRGGHNIHPARIEELASRHPAVARVAAVPVKDARLGERVCLAVTFRPGKTASAAELLAHLDAAGLSRYDMPEYFAALDDIPLTPNGKIRKRDIAEWIKEGRVKPEAVRFEAKASV